VHRTVFNAAVLVGVLGLVPSAPAAVPHHASGVSSGTIGAAERVRLRTFALSHAGLFGDPHPTDLEAVRTTYVLYHAHFGTPANVAAKLRRARTFYVIQMHGHFRLPTGSTNEPKFPYIHVFVSLKDARIAALFLHAHRSLSVLGTVARL
jgi:hypothetical protein